MPSHNLFEYEETAETKGQPLRFLIFLAGFFASSVVLFWNR